MRRRPTRVEREGKGGKKQRAIFDDAAAPRGAPRKQRKKNPGRHQTKNKKKSEKREIKRERPANKRIFLTMFSEAHATKISKSVCPPIEKR